MFASNRESAHQHSDTRIVLSTSENRQRMTHTHTHSTQRAAKWVSESMHRAFARVCEATRRFAAGRSWWFHAKINTKFPNVTFDKYLRVSTLPLGADAGGEAVANGSVEASATTADAHSQNRAVRERVKSTAT